ncbi:hypothetical protein FNT36_09460 [Hymenobacter setariae]|uniref:HMA domain-containing protein n=1 Tax=Hymenobacter setariae TaxID=2594794 RepID=A0A558BYT5_9BACT|nr:hypothetical protein [Hymenobacter setariae]TVT41649.1 hypothetical protein FNT36_09460 [Hymenobacter setariae]
MALLLWANWQEPNLHDYSAPISVGALRVAGSLPATEAAKLHTQLIQMPGITACTVQAGAHAVAYTYRPDEITPAQVQQQLAPAFRVQTYEAPAAPVMGPQCPVPQGYIMALEKLRFALNLRRLFIAV